MFIFKTKHLRCTHIFFVVPIHRWKHIYFDNFMLERILSEEKIIEVKKKGVKNGKHM